METAFNVLMVILGMGFVGGIFFSVQRLRDGRDIMPDLRIPRSVNDSQTS